MNNTSNLFMCSGMPSFNLSWICCCYCYCEGLSLPLKLTRCWCDCQACNCSRSCLPSIKCCSLPKWSCCCSSPKSCISKESCGFGNCCTLPHIVAILGVQLVHLALLLQLQMHLHWQKPQKPQEMSFHLVHRLVAISN